MIISALAHVWFNTARFSGISARKGGLSTTIEACVPVAILWMQSGHAQDVAARRYGGRLGWSNGDVLRPRPGGPHRGHVGWHAHPARSVLGLFAGTVFMGDEPRCFNTLPLLALRVSGVEVRCFVDGSSRAARCPSAAEAVLYRHVRDDTAATLLGEWWLGAGRCPAS